MSKIRRRDLIKRGLENKSQCRKARKYASGFIKVNKKFAINNMAFHLGVNDSFSIQSIKL